MASLMDLLTSQLGGAILKQICSQLGSDENTTKSAIPKVVGLLLSALANNANNSNGAEALSNALGEDHDGSILEDIGGFLGNYQNGDGEGILGHVLGNNRAAVEQNLSKDTGLDTGAISNMLTMVAPLVMGSLGKTRKEEELNAQDIAELLQKEQSPALGAFAGINTGTSSGTLSGAAAGIGAGIGRGRTETYVVQSGDTLSKIAYKFYGDGNRYPEIFEANRDILKNPDLIYPGQKLRIPNVTR